MVKTQRTSDYRQASSCSSHTSLIKKRSDVNIQFSHAASGLRSAPSMIVTVTIQCIVRLSIMVWNMLTCCAFVWEAQFRLGWSIPSPWFAATAIWSLYDIHQRALLTDNVKKPYNPKITLEHSYCLGATSHECMQDTWCGSGSMSSVKVGGDC